MSKLFSLVFDNDATQLSEVMTNGQHPHMLHGCFGLLYQISTMINHEAVVHCFEQDKKQLQMSIEMAEDERSLLNEKVNFAVGDCLRYLATEVPVSTLVELIEAGLPLFVEDSDGRTLVHHAAATDSVGCLQLMIDHGVDVDVTDARNMTPLMVSCREGSIGCIGLLVRHTRKLNHHDVNGETALHHACKSGVWSVVRSLLENGIMFRANNQGETELMIALSRNAEDVALLLIESGVNVKSKNRQLSTVLHYAAKFDCPTVVKQLAKVPIERDNHGYTPFAIAAKNGHHRTLKALLECRPDKRYYDAETMTHNTPLQLATMMGHYRCVKLLLDAGATVDYTNCLSLAAYSGNSNVLALIIKKYKSDLGADWHYTGMDSVNKLGMSPLHVAAMYGHETCVDMLVAEGANPCQSMPFTGETPLMLTVIKNYHRCARIIIGALRADDAFGLNHITSNRKTALHYAATQGAWECIELLIKAGASLDVKDAKGYTPLLLAVENGHPDVVKLLMSAGSDPMLTKQHGWNGLHLAAKNNDLDCVRCLLAAGLSPDSVTWTTRICPAYIAAENGHAAVLSLLLEAGASPAIASVTGLLPVHQAAKNDHADCVRLLIWNRSPLDIFSEHGHTPAMLAAMHGSVRSLAVLISYNSDISDFDFHGLSTPEQCLDVMWLLLQADFRLRRRFPSIVLPPAEDLSNDQKAVLEEVTCQLADSFGSLKKHCRISIRQSLGQGMQFVNAVTLLPLPKELQRYILMEYECARFGANSQNPVN